MPGSRVLSLTVTYSIVSYVLLARGLYPAVTLPPGTGQRTVTALPWPFHQGPVTARSLPCRGPSTCDRRRVPGAGEVQALATRGAPVGRPAPDGVAGTAAVRRAAVRKLSRCVAGVLEDWVGAEVMRDQIQVRRRGSLPPPADPHGPIKGSSTHIPLGAF